MKVKSKAAVIQLSLIGFIIVNLEGLCYGKLRVGFYKGKCGMQDVEAIVAGVVTVRFIRDPTIVAALLRMQYHDCFVNGCDASILVDGSNSEKTATPNQSIRGFDIIDDAKAAVEKACPGVVSCADLVVIATRDAVFLSLGGRYEVQTGRRDGLVSQAQDVNRLLLPPSATVSQSISAFVSQGLTPTDMVLLLGAHSIGVAHCSSIINRLYNFKNTGRPDPTMDPFLVAQLRVRCPENSAINNTVNLDQNPLPFMDNSYYQQLMLRRGILPIDQELASHPLTTQAVKSLAKSLDFPTRFGAAMVKMGAIDVLTGKQGEIRRSCRVINTS